MRGKYQVVLLALFAMALLIVPTAARAGTNFGLTLSSGSTTDVVCDNNIDFTGCTHNSPDQLSQLDALQFSGSVGGWNVQSTTGTTNPVLNLPELMDMTNTSVSTNGAAPITLLLTLTGLTGPLGNQLFINSIGGTSTGNVAMSINVWLSQANTAFCASGSCGTDVLSQSFNLTGVGTLFGNKTSGTALTGSGPYSLTLAITIDGHGSAADVTFDDNLSIPEPATLSVLGAGLLALGTGLRKKLLRG